MGLLDALLQSQSGGLFGGLYPSPMLRPQESFTQPQYDALGNSFGQASVPMTAKDPFGPPPGLDQWAAQFAPKAGSPAFNPFTSGAAAAPFTPSFTAGPTIAPPAAPITPTVAPPQGVDFPQNQIPVGGGYQMPRVGDASNFIPDQVNTPPNAQPAQGFLQPQQLPPAINRDGSGFFDRLNNGLQSIGNGGSLIGALTGNRTDAQSIAQQNLKAQYDALVPMVGPQKAMLAVMNPEAGKTILAQALEKKNYGFTKLDNDTVLRTDPLTGKAEVAYGGGEERGTITGPDGKPIAIPPGVDRKTFVNEVSRANAKAAAGEKTEVQAKAEIFANKMELSNKSINDAVGTQLAGKIASGLPLGNYAQSAEYQKYKQASSNFITALLRQESGAAISKSEFDRYEKEYMPQPGDSKEVLAQKQEARRVAIEGMKKGAGPGYKSPTATALPSGWSVTVR